MNFTLILIELALTIGVAPISFRILQMNSKRYFRLILLVLWVALPIWPLFPLRILFPPEPHRYSLAMVWLPFALIGSFPWIAGTSVAILYRRSLRAREHNNMVQP